MNPIGMMQGRLSVREPGSGLQTFPWATWREEFSTARELGYDLIEWLFEPDRYEQNPIWSEAGLDEIRRLAADSGVAVRTCCAHYFMLHPFFRVSEAERLESVRVLERLIRQAASLGVTTLLIPVLESTEIRTPEERRLLYESLRGPLDLAGSLGLRLALEAELPAAAYRDLIEGCGHPALGVYYDSGNNTARGYQAPADLRTLGPWLVGVHIKDRKLGGPNVVLGSGGVDFSAFFDAIRTVKYAGPIVLETTVANDPLGTAREHLHYVKEKLGVHL